MSQNIILLHMKFSSEFMNGELIFRIFVDVSSYPYEFYILWDFMIFFSFFHHRAVSRNLYEFAS